jgi:hypothetical protein
MWTQIPLPCRAAHRITLRKRLHSPTSNCACQDGPWKVHIVSSSFCNAWTAEMGAVWNRSILQYSGN